MIYIISYILFSIIVAYINGKSYVKRNDVKEMSNKTVFQFAFIVSFIFAPLVVIETIFNKIKHGGIKK